MELHEGLLKFQNTILFPRFSYRLYKIKINPLSTLVSEIT